MRIATLILTLFAFLAAGLHAAQSAASSPVSKSTPVKARKAGGSKRKKAAPKRITAKRITPAKKAAPTKTTAKKITPKRVTPAKSAAPKKKAAPRKITAKKITPKRPRRTKVTPVKFTPGERTLAPISCSTRQTAPGAMALCSDCPDHALSEAYALLGLQYRRGGTSQETGMDCSGFTQHVYRKSCNVDLPRSASQQFQVGRAMGKDELLRGDLVFFKSRRGWHVGIYTGDGHFIHSPNRRSSVKISSLSAAYYKKTYLGARRLTQNVIEPFSIDRPTLESLPDVPALSDTEADAAADEAADAEEAVANEAEAEAVAGASENGN